MIIIWKTCLFKNLALGVLGLFSFLGVGQEVNLSVDVSKSITKIQPTLYGIFFEDINFAADGGLYAEMIKNRSFEFLDPKMGWLEPNSDRHSYNKESGIATIVKYTGHTSNHNYCKVNIK